MSVLDRAELRALVTRIAADPESWRGLVRHGTPERHFEQLWRDEHVDVWVISWTNGNDTGFHDHDVSGGAVAVVEGEIVEERLVVGGAPRRLHHGAGETFDFDASHVHRMHQDSAAPAVSIHAYSPPLWRMGTYAIEADGTLRRESISYAEELRPASSAGTGAGGVYRSRRHRRRRDGPVHRLHAAEQGRRVAVLERGRVGDPATASYGRTRSYRSDYLDAGYARLAHEAIRLWAEFETATGTDVLVRCGCMNIAKRSVTPDLGATYAELSYGCCTRSGCATEAFDGDDAAPALPATSSRTRRASTWTPASSNLPAVTGALRAGSPSAACRRSRARDDRGRARRRRAPRHHRRRGFRRRARSSSRPGTAPTTCSRCCPGSTLQVPITKDRPSDAKYFRPPADARHLFTRTPCR